MPDGHVNKCKECNKKDVIENRLKNLDYYVEYDKLRANLPHRIKARKEYQKTQIYKEKVKIYNKNWQYKNPEKRAAHIILNNRLREGKIKKKNCELCGSRKSQAHHKDYSKPLDVRWLCPKCHAFRHKTIELRSN